MTEVKISKGRIIGNLIVISVFLSFFIWFGISVANGPKPSSYAGPASTIGYDGNEATWIAISQVAVKRQLKDPASAEFRNVFFRMHGSVPMVCGEVNANNSFGGKTGFQRFVASGEVLTIVEEQASSKFQSGWEKICDP